MNRIVDRYYKKVKSQIDTGDVFDLSSPLTDELEQAIIKEGNARKAYVFLERKSEYEGVSLGDHPELEDIISKDASYSADYAQKVIGGRFEKGEDAISTSTSYSYFYAKDVLEGRFEKGEEAISKSSYQSFWYAINVLKGKEKIDTSIEPLRTVIKGTDQKSLNRLMSEGGDIEFYIDNHLRDVKDKEGLSDEDIANFKKQVEYIRELEKYMEVPEVED